MITNPLSIYLNDHLLGATAGVELFRRAARSQSERPWGPVLADLAEEVAEDRAALIEIMTGLDIPRRRYKVLVGGMAERFGRLKPNGGLIRRAPLSDLVELEVMTLGVAGKVSGWQTLLEIAPGTPGLDGAELQRLTDRGNNQMERLKAASQQAARVCLGRESTASAGAVLG